MSGVVVVTSDPAVVVAQDNPAITAIVPVTAQPYSYTGLANLPTLGTAAALNAGVSANDAVQLDGSGRLPAVDGSQLVNIPAGINCGRLVFTSSTQITFQPYKGNFIFINGDAFQIPSGGVAVTNASLSASTLYYVYANVSSGSLALELSTTGHSTSATAGNVGTEIKTGDDTRSLVGQICSNASGQFIDSQTQRFVRSWFNDNGVGGAASAAGSTSTSSGSLVEIDPTIRVAILMWANEVYLAGVVATGFNNTASGISFVQLSVNGSGVGIPTAIQEINANYTYTWPNLWSAAVGVDGVNTFSLFADVSAGTVTLNSKATAVLTQRR